MKNAFLNGDLAKEVSMDIPLGFEDNLLKERYVNFKNLSMTLNNRLRPGSKDLQGF